MVLVPDQVMLYFAGFRELGHGWWMQTTRGRLLDVIPPWF